MRKAICITAALAALCLLATITVKAKRRAK